jgi:hypothetical protein
MSYWVIRARTASATGYLLQLGSSRSFHGRLPRCHSCSQHSPSRRKGRLYFLSVLWCEHFPDALHDALLVR